MSTKTNSFAANMRQTLTNQVNTLSMLTALQKSMTTNDVYVNFDYENPIGESASYLIPSYTSIITRLEAIENALNSLQTGEGTISLRDGSNRSIKLDTIPTSPERISALEDPSTFNIDANWFFEDFMFPRMYVSFDLYNVVEDDTINKVQVSRIILDSTDSETQALWQNNLSLNNYDYNDLKSLLAYNNIAYSEDIEVKEYPLYHHTLSGSFQVIDDPEMIDNNTWYKLDTILYSTISSDGVDQGVNNVLSNGDILLYANSLYKIIEIDLNNRKIRIQRKSGVDIPGVYTMFRYYEDPLSRSYFKTIRVPFGANEYNIIYMKAISKDLGILSNSWSTPAKFDSNALLYAQNTNLTMIEFYSSNVVDWGRDMIAEAKERKLTAYNGHIPNAPTLRSEDLRVVLINTQINAALDVAEVKNTIAEIESTKSQISSLKSTIAALKTDLQNITNVDEYNSMQQQIKTNTNDLNLLLSAFSSLVANLQNMIKENGAVNVNPKYHIRGFFAIPEYRYRDEAETIPEEIIGFDIAYRYIKEDNTGVLLDTYTFTDTDGLSQVTGTFCDWQITTSIMKERSYNSQTGMYEWTTENVANGSEVNINLIDIPITKGEKVEIRVRSISEAGFPLNPLKSVWSNTIMIEFPSNLSVSNEIADLIEEVNSDALTMSINNILDSLGLTSHVDDTIPNTNSVNGLYYKHQAENIAYEDVTDLGVESVSLQKKLQQLNDDFNKLKANFEYLVSKYDWDYIY